MKKYMLCLLISAAICNTNASDANINRCNNLLTDQSLICKDLCYLKDAKIWEDYKCQNYLSQNLLFTPADLQKILKEIDPESFKMAVIGQETGTSHGRTCVEKRYDQYKSDFDFFKNLLAKNGHESLKSGAPLAIEVDLDDQDTEEKINDEISICNDLLSEIFRNTKKLSLCDCGIKELFNSRKWELNRCSYHFKNDKLTHGQEHRYPEGDMLKCRNKIDEINNLLKQQKSKK
jgi:hypothetical protein